MQPSKSVYATISKISESIIARKSKPFNEGEFIHECIIKTAEIMCPEQLKKFKNISLTRNTVASRIVDIAGNLRKQLKAIIPTLETYSIAIDRIPLCWPFLFADMKST